MTLVPQEMWYELVPCAEVFRQQFLLLCPGHSGQHSEQNFASEALVNIQQESWLPAFLSVSSTS